MSTAFGFSRNVLKALLWLWWAASLYASFGFLMSVGWAWSNFSEMPWWRQGLVWLFLACPILGVSGFIIVRSREAFSLRPEVALLTACLSQLAILTLTFLI